VVVYATKVTESGFALITSFALQQSHRTEPLLVVDRLIAAPPISIATCICSCFRSGWL
jgi:hypothetical protein